MSSSSRRTDRVTTRIPIEVSGSCPTGAMFFERTETSSISKFGAAVVLNRKLLPEQELILRNLNGREAEVTVVGLAGQCETGWIYGVKFLRAVHDFWGIEFPPAEEEQDAALRMVMECAECHARELTYLNELEAEVFCHSAELHGPCKHCRTTTRWKQSSKEIAETAVEAAPVSAQAPQSEYAPARESLVCTYDSEAAQPETPKTPPAPPRTANERKHVRSRMQIQICVRRNRDDKEEWGRNEETGLTEDCSRGGFSFCSYSIFHCGVHVEVAIPYREGGANIFVPARIVNVRKKEDGRCRYGVAYVR